MSIVVRSAIVTGLAILGSSQAAAVRDIASASAPRLEVVVLEVHNCSICPMVKAQLLPRWQETAWARSVPMRFIDMTHREEAAMGLSSGVDIVPTFVLMRDGREIERISGYLGPTNFIEAMGHALRREGVGD